MIKKGFIIGIFLGLIFMLVLSIQQGCDDLDPRWDQISSGIGNNGINGGNNENNQNDKKNCPIVVEPPDSGRGDNDFTPIPPTDDGDDNGDDSDSGEDGEDAGHPSNMEQCEVNEFTVCHIPRGNPDNYFTICVGSSNALEAHLGHEDEEGDCEDGDEYEEDND